MATPVADSYSAPSGAAVYAGRFARVSGLSGGATLGDITAAGAMASESRDAVAAGDSLTANSYPSAGFHWGHPLARAPFRIVYNAGVANNTLADLWARWSTDVIAKLPTGGWILLRIGTNSLGDSYSSFTTQYRQFIDSAASNGLKMVMHAIPPKSGVTGSAITTLNSWLAAQAALTPTILKYTDDSVTLGDGSYTYNPGDYIDGIHMNGSGQYKQGVAMAVDYANFITPLDPRISDGTDTYAQNSGSSQYVVNPLMTGTAGGMYQCSGTMPDNWSASNSSNTNAVVMSIVGADVGDPVQTPWLRASINSIGTAGHTLSIIAGLNHPAIAADLLTIKRLDMVMEIRMNALDGAKISYVNPYCHSNATNSDPAHSQKMYMPPLAVTKTMVIRGSEPRDQDGVPVYAHAANTIQMLCDIGLSATSAGPCGSIDFRCASVRGQAT